MLFSAFLLKAFADGSKSKAVSLLGLLFISLTTAFPFSSIPTPGDSTNAAPITTPPNPTSLLARADGGYTSGFTYIPCPNDSGLYCNRTGHPYYSWTLSNYENPYAYGDACGWVFLSSLTSWFETAPITHGSTLPGSTWLGLYDGTTETFNHIVWGSTTTTTLDVWYTWTEQVWTATTGINPQTRTSVNAEGVYAPVTTIWEAYNTLSALTEVVLESRSSSLTTYTQLPTTSTWFIQPAYAPATYVSNFSYSAASPCCGTCTVFGGDVQVYYWPTSVSATATSVSILVDASNFTFTSPSIYVAFQSLSATDLCGILGSVVVTATTVAFEHDALSTAIGYKYNKADYTNDPPEFPPTYTRASWGEHATCGDITEEVYDYRGLGPYKVTYNHCSPTLAVPTELFAINTLWSGCLGIAGFYDPPYILQPGTALLAPFASLTTPAAASSTIVPEKPTSKSAVAGLVVTPLTPTPTPTAAHTPTMTAVVVAPDPPADQTEDPAEPPMDPTIAPVGHSSTLVDPTVAPADHTTAQDPPDPIAQAAPSTHTTRGAISASLLVVGTQTLVAGGPQITISGIPVSLQEGGASVVVAGTTKPLSQFLESAIDPIVVGSQTLIPGGPEITISGVPVSLEAGGSSIVIGGTTEPVDSLLGIGVTSAEGGIGGVIMTLGGFGVPADPKTTDYVQATGGLGYNVTIFTGGCNALSHGTSWTLLVWQSVIMIVLLAALGLQ